MISIQNLRHYDKNKSTALAKPRNLDDFFTDISCRTLVAQECHELTKKRFGKTIQMFVCPIFKQ
jgi:2-iminoacetate synthase